MDESDVIDVLTVAMAYDNRTVGEANVAAWLEAANRAGWGRDEAIEAVKAHYATTREFVMPGDVTERINAPKEAALARRTDLRLGASEVPTHSYEDVAKARMFVNNPETASAPQYTWALQVIADTEAQTTRVVLDGPDRRRKTA